MARRRLPRSARGRALPRNGDDTVTWPPALRGRSHLSCVVVLGWLGGGLLATAVALVTDSPNDLAYGLTNTAGALLGLLLLVVAPRRALRRGAAPPALDEPVPLAEPVPLEVPGQLEPASDDRRAPALR